jgi:cellulose biosynthesis protein BcsQ
VVTTPEPASYAALAATEALVRRVRGAEPERQAHLLVNRFDASRALARDVLVSLRGSFGARVLPTVVSDDEIVREALGHGGTIFREGTDTQVVIELGELIEWIGVARRRAGEGAAAGASAPVPRVAAVG